MITMQLDLFQWAVLLLLICFSFIFLVILIFRLKRLRMKRLKVDEPGRDDGYNMVNAAQGIANNLRSQGIDVSEAQELLDEAMEAVKREDARWAVTLAERAKRIMAEKKTHMMARAEGDEGQEQAEAQVMDMARLDKISTGEAEEKDDVKEFVGFTEEKFEEKRNNYLPAKFTLGVAGKEIEKRKGQGEDMSLADELLARAQELFENKDFDGALKFAHKAKRASMGEEVEEEQPEVAAEPSEELPTAQEDGGEAVRFLCPECESEIAEDDNFCGKCGIKIVVQMSCPKCGSDINKEDVFCRKCGERFG